MTYTKRQHRNKKFQPGSSTVEKIKTHKSKVTRNKIRCKILTCPVCLAKNPVFKRHEARKRIFYVIAGWVIITILGLLIRWKCQSCGSTFTQYPDFALPHKRYTTVTITSYSRQYVEDNSVSYRGLLNECPLVYESGEQSGRSLSHATIHRWLDTLGGYREIPKKARELILDKSPHPVTAEDIEMSGVHTRKYLTEFRKDILTGCRGFFILENIYEKIFNLSIFAGLAQSCFFR
jgi:transposase-like protein